MDHPYLLIVHPDKSSRALLRGMLDGLDYRIAEASGYRVGVGMLGRDPDALILAGAHPGDPEASEFLSSVQRQQPHIPLILLLSGEAPDLANQALRFGASSVLRFPLPTTQVRAAVMHALNRPVSYSQEVARELKQAVPRPASRSVEAAMVGDDLALRQALDLARATAPTRNPALIVGPAGSGKSLLARIIHELSPRRNGPFIEVSCKPRPGVSLEDELFGGWCDGTEGERLGTIARAHGGTLVLDDVNSLSPALQLKLHMVLHDGRIETVTSTHVIRVDVRLILTGSGTGLGEAILGRFWQHVYGQNSSVTLRLPPLQERGHDVIRLAEHFISRSGNETGRGAVGFTPEALSVLAHYPWPGNVAELRNAIRKALTHCPGPRIGAAHLGLTAGEDLSAATPRARRTSLTAASKVRIQPLRDALAEPEKWLILRALQSCGWNRQETADALVINRATLEKKMKKYGLVTSRCQVLRDPGAGSEA